MLLAILTASNDFINAKSTKNVDKKKSAKKSQAPKKGSKKVTKGEDAKKRADDVRVKEANDAETLHIDVELFRKFESDYYKKMYVKQFAYGEQEDVVFLCNNTGGRITWGQHSSEDFGDRIIMCRINGDKLETKPGSHGFTIHKREYCVTQCASFFNVLRFSSNSVIIYLKDAIRLNDYLFKDIDILKGALISFVEEGQYLKIYRYKDGMISTLAEIPLPQK